MKKLYLLLFCLPFAVQAHSGHGIVNEGPLHVLLSAEHLVFLIPIVAALGYGMVTRHKSRKDA